MMAWLTRDSDINGNMLLIHVLKGEPLAYVDYWAALAKRKRVAMQ